MKGLPAVKRAEGVRAPDDFLPMYVIADIGFACLIAWELSAVFAPSLPLLSFCSIEDAIVLRSVSVLVLAACFVLFARRSEWVFEHRNWLFVVGSLAALLTVANTAANLAFGPLPLAVSFVAWALFGVAQASIMTYWGVFFSLVPTRHTVLNIGLGGVGGTVLFVLVNVPGFAWANLLEITLLIIGSAASAAFLSTRIPADYVPTYESFRRAPALSVPAALSVGCHGAVYGFMAAELCSMGMEAALWGGASGIAGVSLVLVWNALGSRVDIDVGVVQRISLPLLVGSVLLFPFFEGGARVACGCVAVVALAHSSLYAWYSTSIDNHEFRFSPVDRFALRQAPSWFGFFLGSVFAFVLLFVAKASGAQLYLVMAVFALLVVLAFSVYGGDESKMKARLDTLLGGMAESDEEASSETSDSTTEPLVLQQRCELVAERYGLTPREVEVFVLLAKGRNAEYIASKLVVSPSTAKSHIYHIYRKLDINSQQRLMSLVDECPSA